MKKIILFLALLIAANNINAETFPLDTTIIREWQEKSIKYKVEIKIRNAADERGIIPGQHVDCYIAIKKIAIHDGKKRTVLSIKDTCDAQVQQLVFYNKCSVQLKDINKDGKKELALLYEFAGDGFDERTIHYLIIDKKSYNAYLKLKFDEEKIKYFPKTSAEEFISQLPQKYRAAGKSEYNRIISCVQSFESNSSK